MFRSHRKPIEQEIAELQRKFRVLDAWLNETLVEAARSQHSQVLTFESLDFDSILYVPDSPKTDASSGFVGNMFSAAEENDKRACSEDSQGDPSVKFLVVFIVGPVRGEFQQLFGPPGPKKKTFNKGKLIPIQLGEGLQHKA